MLKQDKAMGAANPFKMLQLTQDELDYFFGAYCEAGGCESDKDEPPDQITLDQLIKWFYKVPYRFKQRKLGKDNVLLQEVIKAVHYYEEGVLSVEKDAAAIQKKKDFDKELLERKKKNAAENVSMSAADVSAAPPPKEDKGLSFEEERHRLIALGTGFQMHMTFVDFVLAFWNFLSAEEEMLIKLLWEFIEIGKQGNKDGGGVLKIDPGAEDVIQIFQPTQIFKESTRCQNMYERPHQALPRSRSPQELTVHRPQVQGADCHGARARLEVGQD